MTDYLRLTLLGHPGEADPAFKSRLVGFWTHVLRSAPGQYDRVYAEATAFEPHGDRPGRDYMVEPDALAGLAELAAEQGLGVGPTDPDDVYSRNEVSGRDWFQIPHD